MGTIVFINQIIILIQSLFKLYEQPGIKKLFRRYFKR